VSRVLKVGDAAAGPAGAVCAAFAPVRAALARDGLI
jgi:hypothetical protein